MARRDLRNRGRSDWHARIHRFCRSERTAGAARDGTSVTFEVLYLAFMVLGRSP
jgi:hypothetical protein